MKFDDLVNEVTSLPVEERATLVDRLLRSLNPTDSQVDSEWTSLAQKRLEEVRAGTVTPVSGEQVFDNIWKRFVE